MTPELTRAGLARDVVRVLQDARKAAGLEITDRVRVCWEASRDDTAFALREHSATVAAEVLAVSFTEGSAPEADASRHTVAELGLSFTLTRV